MKKLFGMAVIIGSLVATPVFAQGMMGSYRDDTGLARQVAAEEAAGKAVWNRLQAKQASCSDLADDDYEVLGDYYMGLMMGDAHASMDAAMDVRLGGAGNEQMHVAMGKRMSGCDPTASFPAQNAAYFPMMGGFGGMMGWSSGSAWSGPYGMMGWSNGSRPLLHVLACAVTIGLVWTALVLGIIALWKWIAKQKK